MEKRQLSTCSVVAQRPYFMNTPTPAPLSLGLGQSGHRQDSAQASFSFALPTFFTTSRYSIGPLPVVATAVMSSYPLQYESLKYVLQYMEPNLRYQLSSQIPSIRVPEKLVPLRIGTAYFDRHLTGVNNTIYRIGIYREYPEGHEVPKYHRDANASGGHEGDLTEDGFVVNHHRWNLTPGDLDVAGGQAPHGEGRVRDNSQSLRQYQFDIHEKALAVKLEQESSGSTDATGGNMDPSVNFEYHNPLIGPEDRENFGRHVRKCVRDFSVEKLREIVELLRACLLPFHCRQDNIPLPYTQIIQLSVESPRGTQIYRHPYNMKIQEAMKKLNTVLFRGHNGVCYIRSFNILGYLMVVRLPEGLRVRCRELQVQNDVIASHNALKAVMEESSYPLDALTLGSLTVDAGHYHHPIVTSAAILNIQAFRERSFLHVFRELENKVVNLIKIHRDGVFPVAEQIQLIQQWKVHGKELGTFLSYEVWNEAPIRELLAELGNGQENSLVLLMNNGNDIEIQCAPMVGQLNRDGQPKWKVEMRVVAGPE